MLALESIISSLGSASGCEFKDPWLLSLNSPAFLYTRRSLGLESKVGFFGMGGAGLRAMLEAVDTNDAWLDALDLDISRGDCILADFLAA